MSGYAMRAQGVGLVLLCGVLSLAAGCGTASKGDLRADEQSHTAAITNVQLGVGYMRQGNMELALAKLRKALEQDPSLPNAHYAIALLYQRLEQNEDAERHVENPEPEESGYGAFECAAHQIDERKESDEPETRS